MPTPTPSLALGFGTINAETLEAAAQDNDFPKPSEAVEDKVHFAVNNLSLTNIEQKGKEIQELIKEEHVQWLANYLVVKRAAQASA